MRDPGSCPSSPVRLPRAPLAALLAWSLLGLGPVERLSADPPAAPPAAPAPAPAAPAPAAAPAATPAPADPAAAPGAPPLGPALAPAPETPPERKAPLEFPNEGLIERADGKVVYFYRTNFVSPTDLLKSLDVMRLKYVSDKEPGLGVAFTEFAAQNMVLIEGFPEAVEIALEAIAYFDVAAPQVFIETKVIEITWDSNFEFGLDYLFDRNASGPDTIWRGISGVLSPSSFLASTLPGGLPFQGTNLLFGLVGQNAIDVGAFDIAFRALQESGKAEILSKPSIICTQGQTATVSTTESFFVNQLKRADRTNETYETAPANTGVKLSVKALHVGEAFVTIELEPNVKGLAGFASRIGGTLSPIQTERSAKTTVTMGDGETLVIGGLYTNRTVREQARTPLLSDVPLIGSIFTRQREAKQKSELIFMLTPRIVRKNNDPRVIVPPAELERLEKKPTEGGRAPCGCEPEGSIEDALFPKQAWCRDQEQRAAKREARAASPRSSAALPPPPGGAPTAAPARGPGAPPAGPAAGASPAPFAPAEAPPSVRR